MAEVSKCHNHSANYKLDMIVFWLVIIPYLHIRLYHKKTSDEVLQDIVVLVVLRSSAVNSHDKCFPEGLRQSHI